MVEKKSNHACMHNFQGFEAVFKEFPHACSYFGLGLRIQHVFELNISFYHDF